MYFFLFLKNAEKITLSIWLYNGTAALKGAFYCFEFETHLQNVSLVLTGNFKNSLFITLQHFNCQMMKECL